MPGEFYIDTARRMVFSRVLGVVTVADVVTHMRQVIAHPDFQRSFNQLSDFRPCLDLDIPSESLRDFATKQLFERTSKRAFLVNSELQFGLGRMYSTLRELNDHEAVQIFRDEPAALAWLGLETGADPARYTPVVQPQP